MMAILPSLLSGKSHIKTPLLSTTNKLSLLSTASSSNTHHLEGNAIVGNHNTILLLKK